MPAKFGGIKLDFCAAQPSSTALYFTPSVPAAFSEFQATSPTSDLHYGAYTSDLAGGIYTLSWDSLDDMEIWLQKEQETQFVELLLKETPQSMQGAGGAKW